MLIHSHRKNTSVVIDFRETAPKSARPDRYMGNPESSQVGRGSIGKKYISQWASPALQAGPNKNSKLDECFNTFFEALLEGFHKN